MVRKIGNLLLLLLCFFNLHVQADQSLRFELTDLQGNSVDQVEVGVPFLLQLVTHNIEYAQPPQGFESWDNFAVTLYGQNHATTSINGSFSRQTTFTYILTAQQKGTFKLTPLSITDKQGAVISSDTIKVVVGDGVQIQTQRSLQPYILQVDIDEKTVYVGQKISTRLRFAYKDAFDDLRITESPMEHIHRGYVSQVGKPSTLKIAESEYKTQDFLMELYPTKTGTLVIPVFQASFVPASRYQHNIANMFAMVMGGGTVVQSQPRSLDVRPLPVSKDFQGVTAIGHFDSVEFSLSGNHAKVGEGLVAKMIVQGDGNLEIAKAPLLNMPEGLHYYEGNNSVQRFDNGRFSKTFEWIVQAEKAGTFIIPAQEFVYFDLALKNYKVLKSGKTELKISGGAELKLAEQPVLQQPVVEQKELVVELESQVEQKTSPELDMQSRWNYFSKVQNALASSMLTWLIVLLVGVILLSILALFARNYVKNLFWIQTLKYRYRFFACCRKKDIQGIYKLFESLLQQYGLDMSSEQLHQCFITLGLHDESFENWQNFFNMLLEFNFSNKEDIEKKDLAFSLAKQWFAIILSCCKMHKKNYTRNQVTS